MTAELNELGAPINIRVSARAKYACLKVSPAGFVEVVIPKGFNQAQIPDFIAQHQQWLAKTLARMQLQRDPALNTLRPERIHLTALNEQWQVNYGIKKRCGITQHRNPNQESHLWVWTPQNADAAPILRKWLTHRAKRVLKNWLDSVSGETGLNYEKLSVRAQKTRWGSCSRQKHINLNRALLFLPPELVRYLLIHELCHTRHLNHSKTYWSLVARWAPQYQLYEKQLNHYSSQIPLWAYP